MSLPWHARNHQDALDGMLSLSLEERGAYNTILDLIYSRSGPVPDDERWLAGWMGCSVKKWRIIRATLIYKLKLTETTHLGMPALMNERARLELESASTRRRVAAESGAKGGRKSAQAAAKSNDFKDESEGSLEGCLKLLTETDTVQKNPNEPNGSSAPVKSTPKKAVTRNEFLPDSWVVSGALYDFGTQRGLGRQEIDDAADEFRDYWGSRRDAKARRGNWDLSFKTRLRDLATRAVGARQRVASPAGQPRAGGRGTVSFADLYARRHGTGSG